MRGLPRAAVGVAACLALAAVGGAPARGDDPAAAPDAIETRLVDVGALVRGHAEFAIERGPFPPDVAKVGEEPGPMFGAGLDQPLIPFGHVDDLIELVRWRTGRERWDAEGTSIEKDEWEGLLLRGPKALLDEAEDYLARLEREATTVATVDVLLLEGDVEAAEADGLAAAVERGAVRVVAAARSSGRLDQAATTFVGSEGAYVGDEDAEVATESSTADPIISVQPEGLAFQARVTPSGDALRLELFAWHARAWEARRRETVESDPVETAVVPGRHLGTSLVVRPGAWSVLAVGAESGFAVRVALTPGTLRRATPPILDRPLSPGPRGPRALASLDLSDLLTRVVNERGEFVGLIGSSYWPPEPPELSEPRRPVQDYRLAEFARRILGPPEGDPDAPSASLAKGRLVVRADAVERAAVEGLLADLRQRVLRLYRLRWNLVSLPLASFPEYLGASDLDAHARDGGAGLLARDGARLESRCLLRARAHARSASVQGTEHAYVADYDVEVAEKAAIGNPIVKEAFEGLSFDADVVPAAGGDALACEVRIDRSDWRGLREVRTRHGDVECPTLGLLRLRGSVVVPLGASRVAGLWVEDGRAWVGVLSANAD